MRITSDIFKIYVALSDIFNRRICVVDYLKQLYSFLFFKDSIALVGDTHSRNLGDALNKIMAKYIFKHYFQYRYFNPIYSNKKVALIGSVLHRVPDRTIIAGVGLIDKKVLPKNLNKFDGVVAVRGYKTKEILRQFDNQKYSSVSVGDPVLLLPLFFNPKIWPKSNEILIIPHYVHLNVAENFEWNELKKLGYNIEILNIIAKNGKELDLIKKILQYPYILSSSLHGLIIADTYGIPNLWVGFEGNPKLLGDDIKFHDYFSSVGRNIEGPIILGKENTRYLDIINLLNEYQEITFNKVELLNTLVNSVK